MTRQTTKILLAALAAALATHAGSAAALSCSPPASPELAGLWESRQTSRGGIGHTLEFRPDGTFVEATTVLVNMFYRVDGDRLIVSESPDGGKAADGVKFRVEGDTLTQDGFDGSPLKKQRLGKAVEGSPALVGIWRYRHPAGGIAFERYTPDGRVMLRLPMRGSTGCYKANGDRLTLVKAGGKDVALPFTIHTDELVLADPGKPATAYGREEAGPWYDREHIALKPPRG